MSWSPRFPSWPAYSNGAASALRLSGISIAHGPIHVAGSSKRTVQLIVSAWTGLKRLGIFKLGLALRYADASLMFVVSTTSVSPSQWPRASPMYEPIVLAEVAGPTARADA